MKLSKTTTRTLATLLLAGAASARAGEPLPFKVREARPRIWIRADDWKGPSVPELKKWLALPEYQKRGASGMAVLQYLVNGDAAAGGKALAWLCKREIKGSSPSYTGAKAQQMAAYYDWLRNHPDFTDERRKPVVAHLEKFGDSFLKYVSGRGTAMYYSRYPGAIGGLAVIGLALHGDSPKAEAYVAGAYKALVEYGLARQYEGGSSAGGTYSIHHAFPDLARAVFAFESATDAGLAAHIREKQGNWLERQLLWQVWSTLPNGYFVKEGDLWQQPDKKQCRMQIDVLTGLLGSGFGRSHADLMYKRWGRNDYHPYYVWNFFVFNDPEIEPRPLEELGKAELFGRDSHGYVFFRDGWGEGDTHIFFRCGEGMDIHANRGAGGFDIYRHEVLAQRANADYPKGDDHIRFSNTMVFNDHDHPNTEMKTDVALDFAAFLKYKDRKNVECGNINAYEVKEGYARVKGDLSAAARRDCKRWTRELVYLGYTYLLVRDEVETKDAPVSQKWQLHLLGEPKVEGKTVSTVAGRGKLFCRTLLPEDARVSGEKAGRYHRHVVSPGDGNRRRITYLHVLYPTEADVAAMPECSAERTAAGLAVKVGRLQHIFKGD